MVKEAEKLITFIYRNRDETTRMHILGCVCTWLEGNDGFGTLRKRTMSAGGFWSMVASTSPTWALVADFAWRFLRTVASEADSERQLSKMNRLVGRERWRLKSSRVNAWLQFIAGKGRKDVAKKK
jgi:hypothetical protein